VLTTSEIFNRVFKLAHKGLGFMGPHPLWAVVIADDEKILAESYMQKYGNITPLKKLHEHNFSGANYNLYSNLLFPLQELGVLRPQKIFYSNTLLKLDLEKIREEYKLAGIEIVELLSREGENLNKAYFYYEKNKLPYSKIIAHNSELNPALRSGFDCIVFDKMIVVKTNDDFKALNSRTPLRVLKCPLKELNFEWKILSDDQRRNTMILTSHEDIRENQEIVYQLEMKGVAMLAMSALDDMEVLRALVRFKFISVLFEI
jgi:hypothetical protein